MGTRDTCLSAMGIVLLAYAATAVAQDKVAKGPSGAADWPHWAGPNGDCTTDEKGLLKTWPKEGPPVLWRIPVGTGSNHPSVAGDDLCFAQLDDDSLHETVKCVDANTGKAKWSHTYEVPPVWHVGWGELGVRATPTITDQYVYEVGTFGHGFCFDRKTGKIVWSRDFRKESPYLDGSLSNNGNLEWKGFNGSLVPIGDKFVWFYWQGGNPAIPAWDKTAVTDKMQVFAYSVPTGKVVWKFEETCPPGTRGPGLITGSGLPIRFNKEDCLLIHGNREWKILRLADGKQVWNWQCCGPNEAPAWACGGATPIGANLYLDNLDGWQTSLVECDFSQPNPKPKVLWLGKQVHEAVTPPVILNGYLYGFWIDNREEAWAISDKPDKANFSLRCTELKTGKLQWSKPGFHMGLSMSAAEGRIYVRSYQTVTLIEANPNAYVERGRIEKVHNLRNSGARGHKGLLDWNMPVIARGRMYLRTPVEIICYDIRDRTATGENPRQAASDEAVASLPADSAKAQKDKPRFEEIISQEAVVPPGVVYKKTSPDVNRKAFDTLTAAFPTPYGKVTSDDIFGSTLICGPGLWRNIKDDAEIRKITTGKTEFKVPTSKGTQVLAGKLFQGKPEVAIFWKVFLKHYKFDSQTIIRRPTAKELKLYWAMIPYDITEPIFMVKSGKATILAHFAGKDVKVMWIDDYKDMRLAEDP